MRNAKFPLTPTLSHEGRGRLCPHSELRTPNSKGFTLLEVMVAVAILAFVLVSLLGLKNRSVQDVMLAEHITTATLLAKIEMTKALLTTTHKEQEEEGEFEEEEFKDYTWKKTVSLVPLPQVQIWEVRVAVLWKEGEREEMVELVSYE
jgi:general secretion pathway protein I